MKQRISQIGIMLSVILATGLLHVSAYAVGTTANETETMIYEEDGVEAASAGEEEKTSTDESAEEYIQEVESSYYEQDISDEDATEEQSNLEEAEIETIEGFSEEEIVSEEPLEATETPDVLEEVEEEAEASDANGAVNSYTSGYWTYEIVGNRAIITKYSGSQSTVSIPETIGGYTVTEIGSIAMKNNRYVQTLTIPSKVTRIGYNVFSGCTKLSKIYFNAKDCICPDDETFANAGSGASSLSVVFGSGVVKIPECLFNNEESSYAHVTSVSIPSSVTVIGGEAFRNCKDLKDIMIGENVKTIGNAAFRGCVLLSSVKLNSLKVDFGSHVFYNCNNNLCLYCRYGSSIPAYAREEGLRYSYFGAPGATSKVTLTNVASGIKVNWNKVEGATSYYVYRGSKLLFKTSALVVTDKEVKYNSGTKYSYKIVATTKGVGDSPKARTATTYRLMPVGIKSLNNSSAGKMTVTYDKSSGSSGYVVRYSLWSDMSNAKVITVKGANTTSRTFSGMQRGNTYYVQVRTYIIDNGVRYYSGYCTTKRVYISK